MVVDKFLRGRQSPVSTPPTPVAPAEPKAASPAPPPLPIVDFVCEADVRQAMRESRKIYIGPKTIVTPAARELAASQDTIVMAQR